jgi:hypothetical protein
VDVPDARMQDRHDTVVVTRQLGHEPVDEVRLPAERGVGTPRGRHDDQLSPVAHPERGAVPVAERDAHEQPVLGDVTGDHRSWERLGA